MPKELTIDERFETITNFQPRQFQYQTIAKIIEGDRCRLFQAISESLTAQMIKAEIDIHNRNEWNGLVSAYDLKTYALKMEGGAEIGAEGWVKYRVLDAEQARIATTLAYFANFAGVGRKTAMGMGQTCLINS